MCVTRHAKARILQSWMKLSLFDGDYLHANMIARLSYERIVGNHVAKCWRPLESAVIEIYEACLLNKL